MTRPKVRAEDRKRSARACGACKASKKRCDSKLPCSTCVKKGAADLCNFSTLRRQYPFASARPARSIESFVSASSSTQGTLRPLAPREQSIGLQTPPSCPSSETRPVCPEDRHVSSKDRDASPSTAQFPRMLLSATGEKVYVGNTAAISFLEFLRKLLKRHAGSSRFTEGQKSHMMLEAAVQSTGPSAVEVEAEVDRAHKLALIQCFFDVSNGFLFLFTEEQVSRLLDISALEESPLGTLTTCTEQENLVALDLMIAIGARCRGQDEADLRLSATYFSRAQQKAFKGMLHDPSLGMVINFVLMAFYMFCACRRNTGLMYLGVASKAATVLGLHLVELHKTLPLETRSLRMRAWKSLRILDLICNAILGRPNSSPDVRLGGYETDEDIEGPSIHRMLSLNANFESCSILEAISLKLTKENTFGVETTEAFLQSLRDWARALPEELRQGIQKEHGAVQGPGHREVTIGNIHVACTYYFGVLLVTRQFLVSNVTASLQRQKTSSRNPEEDTSSLVKNQDQKVLELSHVCVDAAKLMVQMCHLAASSDLLLGNMCILQAWIFAAGLVLGLSLLDQSAALSSDARIAFVSSREVLKILSRLSPQAERYFEILSLFSEAIDSYQDNLSHACRQSSSSYLEQILRPTLPSYDGDILQTQSGRSSNELSDDYVNPAVGQITTRVDSGDPLLPQEFLAVLPDVSDELGYQLFWDEYTLECANQLDVANADFSLTGWVGMEPG
ncbi:hypothetical protein EDB81DRAFT_871384 [Dactylonectria macrodidyma]|uniref:Zn(2)-C6 fungal-type domain-containing protein n=1 Tax=Dactylonectria macrodidyma TaxID=307937 RepID=A0A9P9E4I2_9HYPO|nr:hypothetical protein EDB81DRAFT_871384 [Dactylonectria macrodidyma]